MGKESGFKATTSFEDRQKEVTKIRFRFCICTLYFTLSSSKYPDRIPIICEKAERSQIQGMELFINRLSYYSTFFSSYRNAAEEVSPILPQPLSLPVRFLVQETITVGEFLAIIRKNIKV